MKRVKLIKLKDEDIMIDNGRDHIQYRTQDTGPATRIAYSDEFVVGFIEEQTLPIQKVVDHGVEHYIAVERNVWEYLYCIENPVTAKSQEEKISSLKTESRRWHNEAERVANSFKRFQKNTFGASLLTRIKWVFTSVKF